jgi:hypothetical protein
MLKFLAISIEQEKEIKRIEISKIEVELSLFVDDMMIYLKDSKHSTKNSQV